MFYQIRYQTGEINDIINEMKQGNKPCMDVIDYEELDWFVEQLSQHGIYRVEAIPYDRKARDKIAEPEFEFRVAFTLKADAKEVEKSDLLYIDVYFEPDPEETYDSVGEL